MYRVLSLAAVLAIAAGGSGCWEVWEEAAQQVIEGEMGCTDEQLASVTEPDLPNCSKLAACCKFLKGECGVISYFTPPDFILEVCNGNEEMIVDFIEQYREISEGRCPDYLTDETCQGTVGDVRTTYISAVDQGNIGGAFEFASCSSLLDATVVPLNDLFGGLLPAACEL